MLAPHKFGSHVVEKCFALCGVTEKEAIAAELINNERAVLASAYGVHVARRCSLSTYKKATGFGAAKESAMEEWRSKERRAEAKKDMFGEILTADATAMLEARLQGEAGEEVRRMEDQLSGKRLHGTMARNDDDDSDLDRDLLDEDQLTKLDKGTKLTQKSKRGARHAANKLKASGATISEVGQEQKESRNIEVERMFSMKRKSLARIREELGGVGGLERGDIGGIEVEGEDGPIDLANAPKDVLNILKVIEATTKGGIKKQRKERKQRDPVE